jgi:hypothetical protein
VKKSIMSSLKQPPNTPDEIFIHIKPTKEFEVLYFEIHQKIQQLGHDGVVRFLYNLLDDAEQDYYNEELLKITKKIVDTCLEDQLREYKLSLK